MYICPNNIYKLTLITSNYVYQFWIIVYNNTCVIHQKIIIAVCKKVIYNLLTIQLLYTRKILHKNIQKIEVLFCIENNFWWKQCPRILTLSFFSTIYLVMGAPPSLLGLANSRTTKSLSQSVALGLPGLLGGSERGQV